MVTKEEKTRISKRLSFVLRHRPQWIGITLDEQGWVNVETLLAKLAAKGEGIDLPVLQHVVATNEKKRYAFNEDGTKIRASQGHSVEVQLGYTPQQPPAVLYHGTVQAFVPAILKQGLQKRKRHHVHLSADVATAEKVGQRRGNPIILTIDAGAMFAQGYAFYISDNGVWLADEVPPQFIERM